MLDRHAFQLLGKTLDIVILYLCILCPHYMSPSASVGQSVEGVTRGRVGVRQRDGERSTGSANSTSTMTHTQISFREHFSTSCTSIIIVIPCDMQICINVIYHKIINFLTRLNSPPPPPQCYPLGPAAVYGIVYGLWVVQFQCHDWYVRATQHHLPSH